MSTPVISTPVSLSMARSPQFITAKNNALPNDTLNEMSLSLRLRTGVLAASGAANFTITKDYSIDEVINFEISDLIRPQFAHNFNVWNTSLYLQSPQGEAIWVIPTGSWTFSNNGATPTNATFPDEEETAYAYLSTDGWAKRDNISPVSVSQAVLATSRDRQALVGNYESLAINNSLANDIAKIIISWESGDSDDFYVSEGVVAPPDPVSFNSQDIIVYAGVGPANLENNSFIGSEIKPSGQPNGGVDSYYDVIVKNAANATLATVRYYVLCEAKYTPVQIGFINRFGVADFITFFKRSDESGSFTQDSYQKSIYNDGFTTPSLEVGKYQSFNVNSRNSLSLNTGFVDQNYDETIKDILMSEYVAVYVNSNWVSVVPQRGSIEYQKSVNTKLINYTMSFEYGFDERSLVR